MNDNPILEKSFAFAVKATTLCRKLNDENDEYIVSEQLLKTAINIGAYASAAVAGPSRVEFFENMNTAYSNAHKAKYFIRLLEATDFIDNIDNYLDDIDEICRILGTILKGAKA